MSNLEITTQNVYLNGNIMDSQDIDNEIQHAQGLINMMNEYEGKDWAVGRNWKTGDTDGIYQWFKDRGMDMETHCYKGGHGNKGAYEANRQMLESYIGSLNAGREFVDSESEIRLQAGSFIVDGQEMDMEAILLSLQIQRVENLDKQLAMAFDDMKKTNDELAAKNRLLNTLREQRNDIPEKDEKARAEKDTQIEKVKGEIDALNSTSQLDMVKLQSLINKRNQAFDMMTNMINKIQGSLNNIVSNMRS